MTLPSTYTKITFPSTNDAVIVPTESNNLNITNEDVPPINTKFFNMGVVNPFDNKLIQTILTVSQNVALRVSTTQLNIHKTTGDGFNLFVGDKVILLTKDDAKYELTITENFTNESTALKFNAVIFDTPIGDGAIITISQSDQFNEGNRKTRGQVAGFTISPSTITKNGIGISSWSNDPTFNEVDNTTLPTSQAVKEYVLSKKDIIETELIKVNDDVINKSAFLHDDGLRFTRIEDGSEMGQINYDGVDTITFNSNGGSSTGATRLDFQVNSGSKMVIDNEGKVGIGTTSPSEKLDVVGNIRVQNYGQIYADGTGDLFLGNTNSGTLKVGGNPNDTIISPSFNNLVVQTSRDQDDIIFKGGNSISEIMRIDTSAGKVGIGTTSPTAKLDISQGAGATAQNVINAAEVAFRFSTKVEDTSVNTVVFRQGIYHNNTENATIAFYRGASSVGGFMTFQTQNGNERMRIDSSGNVGIGTTNPTTRLEVIGDIKIKQNSVFSNYSLIDASEALLTLSTFSVNTSTFPADIKFSPNQTERMRITSSGNVGIGTTGPSRLLHLDGVTAQTSTPFSPLLLNSRTTGNMADGFGGGMLFGINDATLTDENIIATIYGIRNGADNSGALTFNTYKAGVRSEQMRIDKDGKVGIGTNSPKNKLDIVGSLGRGAPVTKTTDFNVAPTENWLIMNGLETITIRLPSVSDFSGRELMIKNIAAFTVISDATNVIGLNNIEKTNAILPATAGSWCTLVCDGSEWITMSGSAEV
jgi:hypothetical protein